MKELKSGDLIKTSTLKSKLFVPGEKKPAIVADYSAGRGRHFLVLLLGAAKDGTDPSPDMLLNHLGWVFDPDRAEKELDKLEAAPEAHSFEA